VRLAADAERRGDRDVAHAMRRLAAAEAEAALMLLEPIADPPGPRLGAPSRHEAGAPGPSHRTHPDLNDLAPAWRGTPFAGRRTG
jgi:hypothetical protein